MIEDKIDSYLVGIDEFRSL